MKTSFTTLAVLAALTLAAPAFAQGNAFFDYQTHLPSRAEQQRLEQREHKSQQPYALTGTDRAAKEKAPTLRTVQAPGNGFTPVELPANN